MTYVDSFVNMLFWTG